MVSYRFGMLGNSLMAERTNQVSIRRATVERREYKNIKVKTVNAKVHTTHKTIVQLDKTCLTYSLMLIIPLTSKLLITYNAICIPLASPWRWGQSPEQGHCNSARLCLIPVQQKVKTTCA